MTQLQLQNIAIHTCYKIYKCNHAFIPSYSSRLDKDADRWKHKWCSSEWLYCQRPPSVGGCRRV